MKRIFAEVGFLLLLTCVVVFFQFNLVPKKLSWDEVEFARLALTLAHNPYIPYSQLATGHSTLYFYIILLSFKIFGVTNFGLRFPSALFGVGNVVIFYFIAKTVFSKLKYFQHDQLNQKVPFLKATYLSFIPLFLSLIFLCTRWYFNFARFSFEVTFLLFLELCSTYFLINFKQKNFSFIIFSAIFAGLAFLSYYPGRIFFIVPLLYLFFVKKVPKKLLIYFSLVLIIVTSPLLIYLSTHKDLRVQEQLFLADKKISTSVKISYFRDNIVKILQMFNQYGDLNGRHNYPGKPLFNPLVGAFFLFGLLITIIKHKNIYNQLFLAFFVVSLAPALFTYPVENPNSLRTFTAVVPSLYFVGNGIVYLLQSERKSKLLFSSVSAALIILFFLSCVYDIRTYFVYQKQVFNKAFELNGTIKRIMNLRLWEKVNSL